MHLLQATEPVFLEAQNYDELVEHAQRVQAGEALAAVLHNAFAVSDLQVIDVSLRKATVQKVGRLLKRDGLMVKAENGRKTVEFNSTSFLPVVNISPEPYGQVHAILPPDIVSTVREIHNLSTVKPINGPIQFLLDEFRSKYSEEGLIHIDKYRYDMDLTTHVTAIGSGVFHITRLAPTVPPLPYGKTFFEPNNEHQAYMQTPNFYKLPFDGSMIVFSAEANNALNRKGTIHNYTTTSPFRASVAIDNIEPLETAPSQRLTQQLFDQGVDLGAYLAA